MHLAKCTNWHSKITSFFHEFCFLRKKLKILPALLFKIFHVGLVRYDHGYGSRYSLLEEFVAKRRPHVEMKSEQCLMILVNETLSKVDSF